MYLLILDEFHWSSQQASVSILGGIVGTVTALAALHDDIASARTRHGWRSTDSLKFSSNTRPPHVDAGVHATLKQEVLQACEHRAVRFIACLVHRDRASAVNAQWRLGLDECLQTILTPFSEFLGEEREDGVCLLDWIDESPHPLLVRSFQAFETRRAPGGTDSRLLGVGLTCNGASHLSSVTDIVLGSLGYGVNVLDPKQEALASRVLLPRVARLFLSTVDQEGREIVRGRGIAYLPRLTDGPIPASIQRARRRLAAAFRADPES